MKKGNDTILVPLHSYNETFSVPQNMKKLQVGSTAHTIKIINSDTDETLFYGLYPDLPKIDKEWYKRLLHRRDDVIFGSAFYNLITNYNIDYELIDILERDDVFYAVFRITYDESDFELPFGPYSYEETRKEENGIYRNFIGAIEAPSKMAAPSTKTKTTVEKKKEGQNKMANLFGDIKVGKAGSKYSLTYFGTIAYEGKTYYQGKIFDATGMTINFDMLYLVPSAEVKKGDIIDKGGKAYYVLDVNNGVVKTVDLINGTEENLVPGGPFGMTMYSKIFNPMGNMSGDNSFGNMLMMQALMGDDGYGSGNGNNGLLLAMMMMQGGFKFPTFEMPNLPNVSGEKSADNK